MKKPRLEIARAVLRLASESQVPVEQLREKAMAGTRSIVRWITAGRGGVFLDGYHKPGVGWVSSVAALDRFFEQTLAASRRADTAALARLGTDGTGESANAGGSQ